MKEQNTYEDSMLNGRGRATVHTCATLHMIKTVIRSLHKPVAAQPGRPPNQIDPGMSSEDRACLETGQCNGRGGGGGGGGGGAVEDRAGG